MTERTSDYKINNATFRITYGDIAQVEAEVLVSSDGRSLSMGGGVSKALLAAGGEAIKQDTLKYKSLKAGDVVVTSAGRLRAKHIFHVVTLEFSNAVYPDESIIHRATLKCMQLAEALGVHHIAFPALGTGIGGFPFQIAAEVMTRTIADYLLGNTAIELVTLTLLAREVVNKSDLNLFYERAVGLASIFAQSKRSNALLAELEKIVEEMQNPYLIKRVIELRSELAQAQTVLAESSTSLEQLERIEERSGIAQISQRIVAISTQTQEVDTSDNRKYKSIMIENNLNGLRNILNAQHRTLNKLLEKKAKYGLAVPTYIEIEIEDLQNEIIQTETRIAEAEKQLIAL